VDEQKKIHYLIDFKKETKNIVLVDFLNKKLIGYLFIEHVLCQDLIC
jgi:hypothetical protein